MSLTPAEQAFFETGELSPELQQTTLDPLALSGLSANPPAPIVETPAPPPIESPTPPTLDAAEILRRSLQEAQTRAGQLEAELQAARQPPTPTPAPLPDPNIDPLGNMMGQLEAVNKTVQDLQKALLDQQAQQQQLSQFQQFQSQVRALKDQFAAATPDFDAAYTHLRTTRLNDLAAFGYTTQQAQQAIFREEAELAAAAIRNGKNPAAEIYEMSKRHGYNATAIQQQQQVAAPDAKLAAIQQAQKAALNLPKSTTPEDFTLDGLKEASDSDLNKLVLDDKAWSKIVGADTYPL